MGSVVRVEFPLEGAIVDKEISDLVAGESVVDELVSELVESRLIEFVAVSEKTLRKSINSI
jgi:hypothetical protein